MTEASHSGGAQYSPADLTPQMRQVFDGLANLADQVSIHTWCLIGGLMVDVVLRRRGRANLRPTNDGDVVGNVVADRSVLRTISVALREQGFEIEETAAGTQFGVRHRHVDTGVYIDLLAPDNTQRLRNVWPPRHGLTTIHAPGSDAALLTAVATTVVLGDKAITMRVPSLAGALYLKVSAWQQLASLPQSDKHIYDAAQLLAAATLNDLDIGSSRMPAKAVQKRWAALLRHLADERSLDWGPVEPAERQPALVRLRRSIDGR